VGEEKGQAERDRIALAMRVSLISTLEAYRSGADPDLVGLSPSSLAHLIGSTAIQVAQQLET
jgi:hypothetical protein